MAGQSVGLINNLPTAAEVVESVIREARAVMQQRLPREVMLDERDRQDVASNGG